MMFTPQEGYVRATEQQDCGGPSKGEVATE